MLFGDPSNLLFDYTQNEHYFIEKEANTYTHTHTQTNRIYNVTKVTLEFQLMKFETINFKIVIVSYKFKCATRRNSIIKCILVLKCFPSFCFFCFVLCPFYLFLLFRISSFGLREKEQIIVAIENENEILLLFKSIVP